MASYIKGRFFSPRDLKLINSLNSELMRDVLDILVVCFKVAPDATKLNIYGEASPSSGKYFYDGVELSVLTENEEVSTSDDGAGSDTNQTKKFKFRENSCRDAGYYPQKGDVISYNNRFYEIDNVIQDQLLGGQMEKSHSIICECHLTRISKLNLMERT